MKNSSSALKIIERPNINLSNICVCPKCHGQIGNTSGSWVCRESACKKQFPIIDGFLDFSPEIKHQGGLGQWGMENGLHVKIYERITRPAFLRSMGRNWNRALTPEVEDQYMMKHAQPADGAVLDLACGAGRWTRTLVEKFGNEQVVGFDLSYACLRASRSALPETLLLRGNALELPFGNQTFGAVNCSNSLQLIPNTPQVLKEIGRILKPNGTFTCFTFRKSPPGPYRAFQATIERIMSVRAFSVENIESWLKEAGMKLVDVSGPNLSLLFTAKKIND